MLKRTITLSLVMLITACGSEDEGLIKLYESESANDTLAESQAIQGDAIIFGDLSRNFDQYDYYSLTVKDSQIIEATLSTSADMNTRLEIFTPNYNRIDFSFAGDKGEDESVSVNPTIDGTYYIKASTELGSGDYQLTVLVSSSSQDGDEVAFQKLVGDWNPGPQQVLRITSDKEYTLYDWVDGCLTGTTYNVTLNGSGNYTLINPENSSDTLNLDLSVENEGEIGFGLRHNTDYYYPHNEGYAEQLGFCSP